MPIVTVDSVHKRYRLGDQVVAALRGASLMVEEGEFLVLSGPSGSGKSTLLNIIGCIDSPSTGHVFIEGQDVSGKTPDQLADVRARTLGFIFQNFNLLPVLSARENVEYPLLQLPELSRAERRERVAHYLDMVGLARFAEHRPNQLSGGNAWRLPAPWRPIHAWYWPTSQPRTSTGKPDAAFWNSCRASTARRARPSYSRPTTVM